MSDQSWSDDRVERLKSLWRDGLSAAQVAKALGGVTRNAVIGKLHRLKLTGTRPIATRPRRRAAPRPARSPARLRRPAQTVPIPALSAVATAPEGPGLVRSFADLQPHACKWPIGDPLSEGFTLCGRAAQGGPYCPGHHRAAHQPRKPPPLAADPLVRRALAGERV